MKFYKYAIVCLIALLIMIYIDVDKECVDKHFKDLEEAKDVAVKIMKGV